MPLLSPRRDPAAAPAGIGHGLRSTVSGDRRARAGQASGDLHLWLEHGLPSVKYGFETGNLVLLVFDGDTPMQAVMKRLLVRPDFDDFAGFIAFSTMQRLQAKFDDWWYVWQGEIRPGRLG